MKCPLSFTVVFAGLLGCGSSGTSSSSAGPTDAGADVGAGPRAACVQVASVLCPLVRACPDQRDGGTTSYTEFFQFPSTGESVGSNPSTCESEFSMRQCDPTESDAYYSTCVTALNAGKATCGPPFPMGTSRVLVLPAECSALLACNGKPGLCN